MRRIKVHRGIPGTPQPARARLPGFGAEESGSNCFHREEREGREDAKTEHRAATCAATGIARGLMFFAFVGSLAFFATTP